jgi:hypothetical protein
MKSDRGDKTRAPERALFAIFANINDHMKVIRSNLASNPAVVAATNGCDVVRYRNSELEEDVHYFEAYVEAETHTGEMFCWLLDVILTSLGWKFQRHVVKQTDDGQETVKEFEDFAFGDLNDLNDCYMALMIQFDESAKSFSPLSS